MDRVDVLIVGAGASGLTLACDLQRRGVHYRIIEASAHGFEGSRAKGIQPRTSEVMDDLGVLAALRSRSTLYPPLGVHLGPFTIRRTMIKLHQATEDVPFANTLLAPQSATDQSLRERLEELGGAIEYGTRLTSYEQDSEGVSVVMETASGPSSVRAAYIVGADGGSSAVRKSAGIAFQGTTDESDRMIVADLSLSGLSRDRWHIWPRHAGRFMALCPLPNGSFQLMLKLRPTDPATLDRDGIEQLITPILRRAKIQVGAVLWSSVWRPNIRLAERYRVGRVLLVGDAAHVHPPTGAQGLNTGVQDAYNLGWKLGQVLAGAPDSLLDSYETERQPVAARVLGLATSLYAHLKDRPMAATVRGDEERQLGLSYRTGPLTSGELPSDGRVVDGDRAPDAGIVLSDGQRTTLFDVFRGPHFSLIASSARAAEEARRVPQPASGAELRLVTLAPSQNATFARLFGIDDDALVVVRPDGYILIVTGNAERVRQALSAVAPLTN